MQDLYFVYFYETYCYMFLMFYIYIFFQINETSSCEDFILFDKALANPNYIPVYMKVNYLFTLCLFKVGRLFYKFAIPKYICVFVIKLSKEKKYFMFR